MYTTASKLHKEANPQNTKRLSPSVIVSFIRKFKVKNRRVQRRKQKPKSDGIAAMVRWHVELREGLIKTGTYFFYRYYTLKELGMKFVEN